MATSQSTRLDAPPYPSYREIRSERIPITFNACMNRLFWPLEGAFPETVSLMKHPRGSKEDLDDNNNDGSSSSDGSGPWHECASEPVTDPKVSSIEFVAYGDLDDDVRPFRREGEEDGDWGEDSEKEFLLWCCGQDRPLGKKGQTLLVTPASGRDFVTVRDFVGAVHPWRMSMRDDLAKAKTVARREAFPGSTSSRGGEENALVEREKWIREHGPPRPADEARLMIGYTQN
ncbi:hypothetical protein F4825DRAFT_461347 [Nemania diffusa]|nr:hypothetical protein F4825DRAFT_461347 [Nemania diffusa]